MKKFYSIVLMAAALLIGTNVWAANVVSVTLQTADGEKVLNYESLDGALDAIATSTKLTDLGRVANSVVSVKLLDDATFNGTPTFLQSGNGVNNKVVLDMNGHNITMNASLRLFVAYLEITGSGTITSSVSEGVAIWLYGYYETGYPDVSHLVVGENVNISAPNSYAIGIISANNNDATIKKCAYGVIVDIYGYVSSKYGLYINGNVQNINEYQPHINIYAGATVVVPNDQAGIYAAGYGFWTIEGTVQGGSGIYAKAGNITVQGQGKVIATATEYTAPIVNNNGYTGGLGCAIIYDSNKAYGGAMTLTVTDEATIQSNTENGYAILEAKTSAENTKTESIVIESGTINGAVDMTAEMKEDVKVNGTISGGTFNTDVTEYLSNVTGVITPVTDEEGNTVYVINEKPTTDPWKTTIEGASATDYVRMNNVGTVTLSADAQAKYLVMQGNDKIVIPSGKKMTVEEIVMGEDAVIEVAAGGKLIVTGAQGIVSNHASNLVLHTSETEQAIFLLNPAVASNKHPQATVEFISKSFVASGSEWARQCFGIPSIGALTDIDTEGNVPTVFGVFNYDTNTWDKVAGINKAPYTEDWSKFANPFEHYQMINYAENPGTKVIMKGALVGNENPQLYVRGNFWNGYANSFMGPMNMEKLIDMIPNTVQKAIYLLDLTTSEFRWEPYSLAFMDSEDAINPLQPFLLRNSLAADNIDIDYADAVYYTPAGSGETKPGVAPAPARRAESNMTKAKLIVKGEGCIDRVGVVEGEDFSAEFDNGYDAAKYMNEGFNMYVSADEKMSIFATDDLNNTYVGLQAVKGGNYTIEFANVQGAELTLIDHETGARVAMVEGNTYEFTAEANSTNDYRFEIVAPAKLPTAIENTEAVKSAKGIYTITGQYVGEMNVWNTLPAGIYVVNGEKLVK